MPYMAERSCWIYRHTLLVLAMSVSLFAFVSLLVVTGMTSGLDLAAEQAASSHRSGLFLQAADLATTLGTAPFLVGAAILAWLLVARVGRGSEAYLPLFPLGVEALANPAIKAVFHRHRPTMEPWPPGLFGVDQYSFPSGHSMSSMALYSLLAFWAWSYWPGRGRVPVTVLLALIPVAIGLSRVALGDHWLSDVVGGWLAGVVVMALVVAVWVRVRGRRTS